MAIEIRTFNSGDTDYIAKLNANYATIKAAIDALQGAVASAGAGSAVSVGFFMDALFNSADSLIGTDSYGLTVASTSVDVAPGGMYLAATQVAVANLAPVNLSFVGQPSDTYYIVVDGAGVPSVSDTQDAGAAWSLVWNGGAFVGDPVRVCNCFYDANEATDSRSSDNLGDPGGGSPPEDPDPLIFETLDDRLEAGEAIAVAAQTDATAALTLAYELATVIGTRKVGATVNDEVGVKGAIQIDFTGTIIGWSIIADAVGSMTVEVSKAASADPPAAPTIPDPVTDKITASAPITLSSAQSANGDESDVSTWDTDLQPYDVLQFKVASAATLTRASLYLRIAQTL